MDLQTESGKIVRRLECVISFVQWNRSKCIPNIEMQNDSRRKMAKILILKAFSMDEFL